MEYKSGNIFIRRIGPRATGAVSESHAHNFDHTTFVIAGRFMVERRLHGDYQSSEVMTGEWILIEAGVEHRLTAMEANSVYCCIYSHRNPQGDVVQEYDGWPAAYQ